MRIIALWPVFLLAVVYSLSWFNPDYMITPILLKYDSFDTNNVIIVVALVGFLEMLGGYIGWSHFRSLMEKWLRDDIEFLKKIKKERETKDFIEWLKIIFARKYFVFINGDGGNKGKPIPRTWFFRHLDRIWRWLVVIVKGGGYFTMFFFGITPIPGFRVIPDILCGTTRWWKGFAVLALANFLKTVGFVYSWSWLFS